MWYCCVGRFEKGFRNVMYEIMYHDDLFWISKGGVILEYLGGYIEPITPEIIIKEIENEKI